MITYLNSSSILNAYNEYNRIYPWYSNFFKITPGFDWWSDPEERYMLCELCSLHEPFKLLNNQHAKCHLDLHSDDMKHRNNITPEELIEISVTYSIQTSLLYFLFPLTALYPKAERLENLQMYCLQPGDGNMPGYTFDCNSTGSGKFNTTCKLCREHALHHTLYLTAEKKNVHLHKHLKEVIDKKNLKTFGDNFSFRMNVNDLLMVKI